MGAPGTFVKRLAPRRVPTRAVRRRHGAQAGDPKRDTSRLGTLALLRCPIPRDGTFIVLDCAGG